MFKQGVAARLCYTVFKTDMGWIAISACANGIRKITLPFPSLDDALFSLGIETGLAEHTPRYFDDTVQRFQRYFAGEKVEFPEVLDFSFTTFFQRSVWKAAKKIPYGETKSYGWLARQIGSPLASRAVGQALGKNPFPIIVPCHRVIAGDGTLGGFTGGLETKRKLLRLEGADVR